MTQKPVLPIKKKPRLHGGAILWLNKNLANKSYDQRYFDAKTLLKIASNARTELETASPFLSGRRRDVRATYNQYKSAVLELIKEVNDTIVQMKQLREEFSISEYNGQIEAYDNQLAKLETRLEELEEDAKWRPGNLKRYRFQKISNIRKITVAKLGIMPKKVAGKKRSLPKKKIAMITLLPKKEPVNMNFAKERIAKLRKEAKELNREIATRIKAGKPIGRRRVQWFNKWAKIAELGDKKIPLNVAKEIKRREAHKRRQKKA